MNNVSAKPSMMKEGQQQQGGKKFDSGKIKLQLLEHSFLMEVAGALTYGAEKYGSDDNWKSGIDAQRVYGSLLRHLVAWHGGETRDPESDLSHLAHAGAQLMFLIYQEYEATKTPPPPPPSTKAVQQTRIAYVHDTTSDPQRAFYMSMCINDAVLGIKSKIQSMNEQPFGDRKLVLHGRCLKDFQRLRSGDDDTLDLYIMPASWEESDVDEADIVEADIKRSRYNFTS